MAGQQIIRPPSPTSPLDYQTRKGELRATVTGLTKWDGTDWVPAILPLYIQAPNGLFYQLTVDNAGVLGTVLVTP